MGAGACLKLDREDRKEELTKKSDAPESIVITAALTLKSGTIARYTRRRVAGKNTLAFGSAMTNMMRFFAIEAR